MSEAKLTKRVVGDPSVAVRESLDKAYVEACDGQLIGYHLVAIHEDGIFSNGSVTDGDDLAYAALLGSMYSALQTLGMSKSCPAQQHVQSEQATVFHDMLETIFNSDDGEEEGN